jgi:hypothetical protein
MSDCEVQRMKKKKTKPGQGHMIDENEGWPHFYRRRQWFEKKGWSQYGKDLKLDVLMLLFMTAVELLLVETIKYCQLYLDKLINDKGLLL